MITTAHSPQLVPFRRNRLLQVLAAGYTLLWIWAAVAPLYRFDWFLENLLVWLGAIVLVTTYRRLTLSDLSYCLIALFTALHTIGTHYTYAETPIGFWVSALFDLERNHFDRIVHFGFGLLLTYPFYELLLRAGGIRGWWNLGLTFSLVIAFSSVYEGVEWIVAIIVDPEAAAAFLGSQGDVFDAQKDSALATVGSLIVIAVLAFTGRRRHQGPGDPSKG